MLNVRPYNNKQQLSFPPSIGDFLPKDDLKEKINLTDQDSQFQKTQGRIVPGYRAEIAVDSKEQIIVANDVTVQQADNSQLIPMVDKILENISKNY